MFKIRNVASSHEITSAILMISYDQRTCIQNHECPRKFDETRLNSQFTKRGPSWYGDDQERDLVSFSIMICEFVIQTEKNTIMTSYWVRWRLKSPASCTIVYPTVYSRRRSKKTSQLRVTGFCVGNSPVTDNKDKVYRYNIAHLLISWPQMITRPSAAAMHTIAILVLYIV